MQKQKIRQHFRGKKHNFSQSKELICRNIFSPKLNAFSIKNQCFWYNKMLLIFNFIKILSKFSNSIRWKGLKSITDPWIHTHITPGLNINYFISLFKLLLEFWLIDYFLILFPRTIQRKKKWLRSAFVIEIQFLTFRYWIFSVENFPKNRK